MPQTWRVVGGEATGGILVRSGQELGSSKAGERLATGAVVCEESLVSNRLQYKKLVGDGPSSGWVSVSTYGKELLVKCAYEGASSDSSADASSENAEAAPGAPADPSEDVDEFWQRWLGERFGPAAERPPPSPPLKDRLRQLKVHLQAVTNQQSSRGPSAGTKELDQLAGALVLVRQAADRLDAPPWPDARLKLRCATPGCPYRVHSWDALGDYCCNACHASGGGEQHTVPRWPRRGATSRGALSSPWRTVFGREAKQDHAHGARCEHVTAHTGARRADGWSAPLPPEKLRQLEFEDAVHLVNVHLAEQPRPRTGKGWLEADPSWSRSGSLAVGTWVSSIIRDSWGSPSTGGPQQLLEGGAWTSENGKTTCQWIVFDLGRTGFVSEVRTRGHHTKTARNAQDMEWQAGAARSGPWDTVARLSGRRDNAWSIAVLDPPVESRWWRLLISSNWGDQQYVWLCGFGLRLMSYDDDDPAEDGDEAARQKLQRDLRDQARCDWLTDDSLREEEAECWLPGGYEKLRVHALLRDKVLFFEDAPYADSRSHRAGDLARAVLAQPLEEGWTLDYSADFFCELAFEGFQPSFREVSVGDEFAVQVFSPRFEFCRSIIEPLATHVSRKARKRAGRYTLTVGSAYDTVLLKCMRQHGQEWLLSAQRWLQRALRKDGYRGAQDICVAIQSFELWDADGHLVAGDLGYTVGGVYVSQSSFHLKGTRGLGELLLVLVASLLHKSGHAWLDLGGNGDPVAPDVGAKTLDRMSWLERFRGVRKRRCRLPGPEERFRGGELLEHLLGCQHASRPPALPGRGPGGAGLRSLDACPDVLAAEGCAPGELWASQPRQPGRGASGPRHYLLAHSLPGQAVAMRYLLTLPTLPSLGGADAPRAEERLPLLVYLHSAPSTDERMNTLARQVQVLLEQAPQCAPLGPGAPPELGAFVGVAPLCPLRAAALAGAQPCGSEKHDLYWFKTCGRAGYERWDFSGALRCPAAEHLVVGLLAQLCAELPVDARRVYLVGHSAGGYGVLRLAELLPELPAAVVPISGYYPDILGEDHDVAALAERLKQVPRLWPMHCPRDQQCRIGSPHVAELYRQLQGACGAEVEWVSPMLSLGIHGDCHWALRRVLAEPARFLAELLQSSRAGAAAAGAEGYLRERLRALQPPPAAAAPPPPSPGEEQGGVLVSLSTGIYGGQLRLRRRALGARA